MSGTKADIIARLRKEILPLQGFRTASNNTALDEALGPIKNAFPNFTFPLGAIHEFIATCAEDATATCGFLSGLLSSLMQKNGVAIWVSANRKIFPPALKAFGIEPDKIIFIDLKKEKEILWTVEEALKCKSLSAVIGEMQEISFTASRRLQAVVEQSQVTGFILRSYPRNLNTTACVTRWKISSLASTPAADMPGVGFPRWNVELMKVRNGRPGIWQTEFVGGQFIHISRTTSVALDKQKKAG